jgi:hypothetical protein
MTNFNAKYVLIFLLFSFVSFYKASAQVNISPVTGGLNISNDLSSQHPSGGGYTALSNIVITATTINDFEDGDDQTIVFDAPSGWRFNTGASVSANATGVGITNVSVVASSAQITVTFSVDGEGSVGVGSSIVISGVEVQSTTKVLAAGELTRTGGTANIFDFLDGDPVATLTKIVGAPVSLQVLLPGETNEPGTLTGKAGTFAGATAGDDFTVTVNAVDYGFNVCTTVNDNIQLSTGSNSYFKTPVVLNHTLVSGSVSFDVALTAASTSTSLYKTITATNITNSAILANTSSNITVNFGAYEKILLLLPGEVFVPGSATGKTGTVANIVSDANTSIVAYAVDEYWNRISTGVAENEVELVSTDPLMPVALITNISLNGAATFSVQFKTVGNLHGLTVKDRVTNFQTSIASLNVLPGAFSKLQILLPGETNLPFSSTGKDGVPSSALKAGESFNVVVNAVDANWNLVGTVTDEIALANVAALYAPTSTIPASVNLTAGTTTVAVTLNRAATDHEIVATHINDFPKPLATSSIFSVSANDFVKLQVLLPGETADPGTLTGKLGTPNDFIAGTINSGVVINAVDNYWNLVNTVADELEISTPSLHADVPVSVSLVAGVATGFPVMLRAIGTTSFNVENITNPLIIEGLSSDFEVVSGGFVKLQILLPGEIAAPGTILGKTGTPDVRTAGEDFNIRINAVDEVWNIVSSVDDVVSITSSDLVANIPGSVILENGFAEVTGKFISAGIRTISVANATDGTKLSNSSPNVTVNPGEYVRLVALLPNQNLIPSATGSGIVGNPMIPALNTSFIVTLKAVDAYFNPIHTIPANLVNIINPDITVSAPISLNLAVDNNQSISVTVTSPGEKQLTFTDVDNSPAIPAFELYIYDETTFSAQTDFFRTATSGNWTNTEVWESSPDGATWGPATLTPDLNSNLITIRLGNVVEVTSDLTIDQLTIESGAELMISSGTFTIANGSVAPDLLVNGVLSGRNTGLIVNGVGSSVTVSSSGVYRHRYNTISGAIPVATWADGSRIEFLGYTSYNGTIENSSQSFSNLVWNSPRQNNAGTGPAFSPNFDAKNIEIISTGSGKVFLGGASPGSSDISGDFTLTNGNVGLTKTGAKTINLKGNLSLVQGSLSSDEQNSIINFNGTGTQVYSNDAVTMSGAINFDINSGATVDFGTSIIAGTTGTFNMAEGSSIITANADGLNLEGSLGSIQNTGTRYYSAATSYTYNGTVQQITGSGLPPSVTNLTIDNEQGVIMRTGTGAFIVTGVLSVNPTEGFFDLVKHPLVGSYTTAGDGRIKTAVLNNAVAVDKTWTLGVEYNAEETQNIVQGIYTNLLATSGSGVKVTPSGILNVSGNWQSDGGRVDFLTNTTTLNFDGSSAQSLVDLGSDGGAGLKFEKVTFNGLGLKTITSGKFSLGDKGILTMGSGSTLNANGLLTILSSAEGTGMIDKIPTDALIDGDVVVQRYMKGGSVVPFRTYRMLSSPVHTDAVNKTYTFSQFIDDMPVTGVGGVAGGFDVAPVNQASAWTYEPANVGAKYVAIPNINTSLRIGQGAYLFYRGDRSIYPASVTSPGFPALPNGIVDFEGKLNQQDVSVPLVYNGELTFNLVGNPYASTINWANVYASNSSVLANQSTWVWDSSTRQYAVSDGQNGVNGGSSIIPSGQGFFVQAGSAGALTFTEDAKVNDQPTFLLMSAPLADEGLKLNNKGLGKLAVGRKSAGTLAAPSASVRVTLAKENTPFSIQSLVVFDEAKSASFVSNEDVPYLKGSDVFFSTLSDDNVALSINYMPALSGGKEVKLAIEDAGVTSGAYSFKIAVNNLPTGYSVSIKDKFLDKVTPLSNDEYYHFDIDKTNVNTYGVDRFKLVLDNPKVLPIDVVSFKGTKTENGVSLTWSTDAAKNANRFELERAGEDKLFETIAKANAKGEKASYSYLDKNPLFGNNYYRLKQVNNDSKETLTNAIVINFDGQVASHNALVVFPNPVGTQMNLKVLGELESNNPTLRISNAVGQVVYNKALTGVDLSIGFSMNVEYLTKGVYVVEVLDAKSKVIRTTKLIKK